VYTRLPQHGHPIPQVRYRRFVSATAGCPRGRVRNRQAKTWGSKQGDGEVSEKSHGKRVKGAG
jgi:hypothetical protein